MFIAHWMGEGGRRLWGKTVAGPIASRISSGLEKWKSHISVFCLHKISEIVVFQLPSPSLSTQSEIELLHSPKGLNYNVTLCCRKIQSVVSYHVFLKCVSCGQNPCLQFKYLPQSTYWVYIESAFIRDWLFPHCKWPQTMMSEEIFSLQLFLVWVALAIHKKGFSSSDLFLYFSVILMKRWCLQKLLSLSYKPSYHKAALLGHRGLQSWQAKCRSYNL